MPKNRRLLWAPAAKDDLRNIWHYRAQATSPQAADNALRATLGLDRLETPGRARDEVLPGLRSVLSQPYTIFFRLGDDRIEIVRVLHGRRDLLALFAPAKT